ncbi:hypothetical protein ETAA8_36610 [Anatilimnocola aggregata]|uniref:Uncharacterized protein n=1 Tax=Anatilimnocola aggregata TaxID=2528021 RepID=A0A517YEB0_9BACT|nr:hypothetical protein ETAA8_36610 [Anatilimnocola aggregata]
MQRLRINATVAGGLFLLSSIAAAQDSGPGPTNGLGSKRYDVVMFQAGAIEQGTLTFERSSAAPPPTVPTSENTQSDETGAGNDTTGVTANPTATGDNGTVGNPNGAPGNVTGNTSGSTGTSNTSTTGTTAATSDPPSYWTRDRANGQIAAQTNDSTSSNYWTRARVNG